MVSTKKLSGEMSVRYVKSDDSSYANYNANTGVDTTTTSEAKVFVMGGAGAASAGLDPGYNSAAPPSHEGHRGDGPARPKGEPVKRSLAQKPTRDYGKRLRSESADELRTDGGWGWVVCAASFSANAVLFGILNTFGIIYVSMMDAYKKEEDDDIAFKTAWVGSIQVALTFIISPVASRLINVIGLRFTALLGVVISSVGMFLSSFADNVNILYLTYGVFTGAGGSLIYTPSILILGHYFRKHLGLANGVVSTGSAVSTILLPLLLRYTLSHRGLHFTLRLLACGYASLVICIVTWCPSTPPSTTTTPTTKKAAPNEATVANDHDSHLAQNSTDKHRNQVNGKQSDLNEQCLGTTLIQRIKVGLRNSPLKGQRGFVIWAIAVPIGFLCYFTPFMHLVKHVNDILPDSKAEHLIMLIGASSGVSRLISGKLSDYESVSRVRLQQISFAVIGLSTAVLPLTRSFPAICCAVVVLGLADGCCVCMLAPIAFDLVGLRRAPSALAFLYFMMSIPLTVGGPLSGWIYDQTKSYDLAFYIAGIPPLLAALIMQWVPKQKVRKNDCELSEIKIVDIDEEVKEKTILQQTSKL